MSKKKKRPKSSQRTNDAAKSDFNDCIRDLQKIKSLLVPVQYAALYDVEFDVADALTTVLSLTDRLLIALDQLEVAI